MTNKPWDEPAPFRADPADRRTLALAAASLFIFGCFLGCALYRLLGLGESELYENLIERYFIALFSKCTGPLDILLVVADCFLHEARLFWPVFFGGFTLFTLPISGAMLLYRGLLFGFSVTMLQFSAKSGLLLDAIGYLGGSAVISCLLISLSVLAYEHYRTGRPRLSAPHTRLYLLAGLKTAFLLLSDVCLTLFFLYVYL